MSNIGTFTKTETFTLTHARYIASKVAADLRRFCAYYGQPSDATIDIYVDELTELLVGNYVESIEYGFKKDGQRVVSLKYKARPLGGLSDSGSGSVYARANTVGATWFSSLSYTVAWHSLSEGERAKYISSKFRVTMAAPRDGAGYWQTDRSYSAGGVSAARSTFRPY